MNVKYLKIIRKRFGYRITRSYSYFVTDHKTKKVICFLEFHDMVTHMIEYVTSAEAGAKYRSRKNKRIELREYYSELNKQKMSYEKN